MFWWTWLMFMNSLRYFALLYFDEVGWMFMDLLHAHFALLCFDEIGWMFLQSYFALLCILIECLYEFVVIIVTLRICFDELGWMFMNSLHGLLMIMFLIKKIECLWICYIGPLVSLHSYDLTTLVECLWICYMVLHIVMIW
jgi:hypothetical protein